VVTVKNVFNKAWETFKSLEPQSFLGFVAIVMILVGVSVPIHPRPDASVAMAASNAHALTGATYSYVPALSPAYVTSPPPPLQQSVPVCDHFVPINMATTSPVQLVTAQGQNYIYVCSIQLISAGANNVAMYEGTGAGCGTSNVAGMAGGTTTASGWNFAANGYIQFGSGTGAVAKTAFAANGICMVASAATQVSGVLSWTAAGF
jgi:hypothetical protein